MLTEGAGNPTQSSRQKGSRSDSFQKILRKDVYEKGPRFREVFSFLLLQMVNVIPQFSAPSQGILPGFKRCKDL